MTEDSHPNGRGHSCNGLSLDQASGLGGIIFYIYDIVNTSSTYHYRNLVEGSTWVYEDAPCLILLWKTRISFVLIVIYLVDLLHLRNRTAAVNSKG